MSIYLMGSTWPPSWNWLGDFAESFLHNKQVYVIMQQKNKCVRHLPNLTIEPSYKLGWTGTSWKPVKILVINTVKTSWFNMENGHLDQKPSWTQ